VVVGAFTGGEEEAFADERIGLKGGIGDKDGFLLAGVALTASGGLDNGAADEAAKNDGLRVEDEGIVGRSRGDALLNGVLEVGAVLKRDEAEIVLAAAADADAIGDGRHILRAAKAGDHAQQAAPKMETEQRVLAVAAEQLSVDRRAHARDGGRSPVGGGWFHRRDGFGIDATHECPTRGRRRDRIELRGRGGAETGIEIELGEPMSDAPPR
jgi:hypothetical protein